MELKDKKSLTLVMILIVAGIIFTVGLDMVVNPKNYQPTPITVYQNITVAEAYEIIEDNETHVVDVRGLEGCGTCQFNKGHLPKAFRYTDPTELYNLSNPLLVYSADGSMGAWFCEQLMGHVYGNVYNLEGGWNAWSNYYLPQ